MNEWKNEKRFQQNGKIYAGNQLSFVQSPGRFWQLKPYNATLLFATLYLKREQNFKFNTNTHAHTETNANFVQKLHSHTAYDVVSSQKKVSRFSYCIQISIITSHKSRLFELFSSMENVQRLVKCRGKELTLKIGALICGLLFLLLLEHKQFQGIIILWCFGVLSI